MHRHTWQKSSYCAQGGACVHVGTGRRGSRGLTESGDPAGAILRSERLRGAHLRGHLRGAVR
ncbi:DUF397 domain-containing protein [Streptomyces sp. NBC_00385]|nr:DUF397 domain-containing protein [Streptomyces sp. NBC_00385]